jgi:hypothetical protein
MQCACAILSAVACPSLLYFSTLSRKRHDLKKILNIKCVLISSTSFVWKSFRFTKNWARYDQKHIMVFMYSTRYSCQILMKLNFLDRFSINTHIQNFMKIRPVGAKLFHRTKPIVACRNFANAPDNADTGFLSITSGFPLSLWFQRSSMVIFFSILL